MASILPIVNGIQWKQQIPEGGYVACVFDMEIVNGIAHVFDWIQVANGEIKAIRTFYDPKPVGKNRLGGVQFTNLIGWK